MPTARERDLLTLPLSCASGATDAFSYLALGHVFTANMTGNTVLLGIALSTGDRERLVPAIVSLFSFVIGVAVGGCIATDATDEQIWPPSATLSLAIEALILTGVALVWLFLRPENAGPLLYSLTASGAFALGMQSATVQRLKVPGIVTTYISGTWTAAALSMLKMERDRSSPAKERIWKRQATLQGAVVVLYLLSAVLVGVLVKHRRPIVGMVPSLLVIFVAVFSATRIWQRK